MTPQQPDPTTHDERRTIFRLFFTVVTGLHAIASSAQADEQRVAAELIEQVARFESNYERCVVNISTLRWRIDRALQLDSIVTSTILQWDQSWWRSDSTKFFATVEEVSNQQFAWRQPDGKYALYSPPDQIEVSRERQTRLRSFQPYANLLLTLGFDGSLSEFLKGDSESLHELRVTVATDPPSNRVVSVRGVRRLPGSRQYQQVFELHLSRQHQYLPVWGRYYEVRDGATVSLIETTVTDDLSDVSEPSATDLTLTHALRTTNFPTGNESSPRAIEEVRVHGEFLQDKPDQSSFGPPVFIGSGIQRYIEDGATGLKNPYQTAKKTRSKSESPFVIWLIVNDVVALVLAVALLFRHVWQKLAAPATQDRRLATETTSHDLTTACNSGVGREQASDTLDPATEYFHRFRTACARSLWSRTHLICLLILLDVACLAAAYGTLVLFTVIILSLSLGLFLAVAFRFVVVMLSIVLEHRQRRHEAHLVSSESSPPGAGSTGSKATEAFSNGNVSTLDDTTQQLPVYTILVPLYREANIAASIIRSLARLDYPRSHLDIKLLLEHDDPQSLEAVLSCDLGPEYDVITVPPGLTKTKPRACDYGLVRARGDFTVIFDAEDRPEPDQLMKAVAKFRTIPPDVACLQAKLNYFNPRDNFLTRCFAIEYTTWFDLVLPGLQVVNAPIPLGGTSNHFRTSVLQQLGGWDPYNVTEDCDLGVRIAVNNYRTMILDSTTWEEANSELGNWIRQRSRWVKGYLQTHLVHTKKPIQLVRQLGFLRTIYFLLTVGGVAAIQLLYPVLWFLLFVYFGLLTVDLAEGRSLWTVVAGSRDEYRVAWKMLFWGSGENPVWASISLVAFISSITMFLANGLFIAMNLFACRRRHYYDLWFTALLSPIYWFLASIAAWKGAIQLITKPHFWEKTRHGLNVAADPSLDH